MLIVMIEAVTAGPDETARLLSAARELVPATLRDKGCLHYSFAVDAMDPAVVRVTERWQDNASMKDHLGAPHTVAFLGFLQSVKLKSMTAKVYDASGERDLF
jgi:quinol monooxygenase YgiN